MVRSVYTGCALGHAYEPSCKVPIRFEFNYTEVSQHILEKFQEDPFSRSRIAISVTKDGQRDSKRQCTGLQTHLKPGYYLRHFRL